MVPPVSHRVSRVPWYSGSSPLEIDFRLPGSHRLWQAFPGLSANQFPLLDCPQPQRINPLVWPLPRSLAATYGIEFLSLPRPTLMFQFRRFPTYAYLIQRRLTEYCSAGFPHSEISGSTVICTSPKLIAACHVLHRLLMPRHSPCALLRLTLLSCEQESKQRKLSWTTTLRQCLLLPLLSYSPLYKERSRSGSQAFELCRLRVLRNCFVLPFRKVPQIIFVSLCCLLFILGYFVQFSRCVSSFFRNQIQTFKL